MPIQPRMADHVLAPRLGTEEFEVTGEDTQHYLVRSTTTKQGHQIYKALVYLTPTLVRANHQRRVARAETIGRPQ